MDAPFPKRAKPCKRERSTRLGDSRLPDIDASQSLRFLALQNEDISKERRNGCGRRSSRRPAPSGSSARFSLPARRV